MSLQPLETHNAPDEKTQSCVPAPPAAAQTKEVFALHRIAKAQIQQAFERVNAKDKECLLQGEFEDVLATLHELSQKRINRRHRISQRYQLAFLIGFLISVGSGCFDSMSLFIVCVPLGGLLILGSLFGLLANLSATADGEEQQQQSAALAMARFEDVRAVGALAQALQYPNKDVMPIATQALIRLLPRMRASDASLLSPEQRSCLNQALHGKNTRLILAILKAWEQVGDTDAIPYVQLLASKQGRAGWIPQIAEAARECLPFLQQSVERQQMGAQLLRPSSGNYEPSEVLLRPTTPSTPTDPPDQLLRPTDAA